MADVRRLGKRGSYRLGRLGVPPPEPARPPRPHYPSWRPARRGPLTLWLAAALAGAAVIAAGAALGWWFVPSLVGLAAGVAARFGRIRLRIVLPVIAAVAAAGWAVPLARSAPGGLPEWQVARAVAVMAGLPPLVISVFVVALLVAAAQALAGCWVARMLTPRRLTPPDPMSRQHGRHEGMAGGAPAAHAVAGMSDFVAGSFPGPSRGPELNRSRVAAAGRSAGG